ncbi:hypothetical protein PRK78_007210 [Emydomyces testavorans]|uniref:DUF4211 domain-containing protein n=1 Tax=Emydomyces testavorans TaxID=2070801 RepID=A0AAF0DR18_9EURO|nr:hypothetical protein PRK78_007210 [Emydomyces testavorans]
MRHSGRSTNTKRQTRLSFSPAQSSSSPGPVHSSQVADRLANVRCSPLSSSPHTPRAAVKHEPLSSSPLRMPIVRNQELLSDGDDDDDDDEEESIRAPVSIRRTGKRKAVESIDSNGDKESSESEDIVTSSPVKRRRSNGGLQIPVDLGSQSEQELQDLKEDLEDLRDSVVTKRRTRGNAAESAVKLRRREQLEALRRRRAGEKQSTPPQESGDSEDEVTEEEGSDSSISSSSDEDIPEDSDVEAPVPEDLDEYEKDFVLQDDDAQIGVPADLIDMPFEFSRHRYKRLQDHFKDVVEWMVHNKLNPAFPREDEVYRVAFDKVNDEVMGVAGSQLISSTWRVDFRRALTARPGIEVTMYPSSVSGSCDACGRSKHPAKCDIRFSGKPYLLETLEPVFDDEDSEPTDVDDDESGPVDKCNIDRDGHRIPDADTHFYLGKFCKAKATMAHTLIHWRFHLNEWVVDYLQHKGIFANEKILEREKWSVKKRTRYANEEVDAMQKAGEIDRLWKDFNLNLKTAREQGIERRW